MEELPAKKTTRTRLWREHVPLISSAVLITGYEMVPANSEEDLLNAVSMQPVSITIDASADEFKHYDFRHYQSGVFSPTYCGTSQNHAVTVVGYGTTEDGIKYWLLKNQWGESWGENGYMKILRDAGAQEVSVALLSTLSIRLHNL
ncbi:ervatamin-C [Prunus yedoensis var. nudiflora]|uniref:Ervatamin-C n=1 Tax=Prunus yedoensis var. nudiflora TaxID=2094558 RepID=A0A314ZN02_PRUYE|nr:ervatamin-C [Prunus yedoensis var. nudiflora]